MYEIYYALYMAPCFLNIFWLAIIVNDEFFWQGFAKDVYWARDKEQRTLNFLMYSLIPIYNLYFAIFLGVLVLLRWLSPDNWLK